MNIIQKMNFLNQRGLTGRIFVASALIFFGMQAEVYAEPSRVDIALTSQQFLAARTAYQEAQRKLPDMKGYSVRLTEDGENFVIVFAYGDPMQSARGAPVRDKPAIEVLVRKRDGALIRSNFSR